MNRKKITAFLMSVILVLGVLSTGACAISTDAVATCVMDVTSGRVLYADNEKEQRAIASTTKIMTGLLAVESGMDLDQMVTISKEAAAVEESSMYLEEGDQVSIRTLLYGTMLKSGNDAAYALAEAIGGTEDQFVERMNEKAQEIGMTDSHFSCPNGLIDEGNYSTAYDMALLGCYAIQNADFREVVDSNSYDPDDWETIYGHNQLLNNDSRCIGIKTGYTDAAGKTFVSCDEVNGQKIVCVTLDDWNMWADHQNVYDWAFDKYPLKKICQAGKNITKLTLSNGQTVRLTAAESVTYPISSGEKNRVTCKLTLPANDAVELTEGAKLGVATYYFKGKKIASVDLLCGQIDGAV